MIESQLTTLGLLFLFAIIGGLIAARFRQPVVLGLLVVGALIGPNLLGLVNNQEMIEVMVDFGAILFLFVMGLEFSLRKLMKTGLKSIVVTVFKMSIMFFLGFGLIMILGLGPVTAAFVGVSIASSSTMIILNVLKQKNLINKKEVPLIVAVLVLDDILGVVALTYFASMRQNGPLGVVPGLADLVISLTILVFTYVILSKYAEKLVKWLTKHAGEEIVPFISLGLCAGFAYLAFSLKLTPGAGAFLAGSVVSTFKDFKIFEHSIKPHSMMFTTFFFISMGTMVNFKAVIEYWQIIVILLVVMFLGLFIAMGLITKIFASFNSESAIFSSLIMLPPGIFSLLFARESMKFGVTIDLVSIISVIILLTSIIMTFSIKYATKLNSRIDTSKPSVLGSRINKLSSYISSFFDEIDVENANTFRLKRKARKTFILIIYALLFSAISYKIVNYIGLQGLDRYLSLGSVLIVSIIIIYFASQKGKEVNNLIIKILSGLEGGTREERIRRIVKNLERGITFSLLGLISPVVIFTFNGAAWYMTISLFLIIMGVFFFWRSMRLLTGVSMNHKYTVHTYRKINVKKSIYD